MNLSFWRPQLIAYLCCGVLYRGVLTVKQLLRPGCCSDNPHVLNMPLAAFGVCRPTIWRESDRRYAVLLLLLGNPQTTQVRYGLLYFSSIVRHVHNTSANSSSNSVLCLSSVVEVPSPSVSHSTLKRVLLYGCGRDVVLDYPRERFRHESFELFEIGKFKPHALSLMGKHLVGRAPIYMHCCCRCHSARVGIYVGV